MGDRLRERIRSERERREWSQAELANMLSDKGIHGIYPTTVAKLESGDRAIRVDELAAIADLFSVSVDALLGRNPASGDLVWVMSQLNDLARRSAKSVEDLKETITDLLEDVEFYATAGAEKVPVDEIVKATRSALEALETARIALGHVANHQNNPGVKVVTK